MNPPAEEKMHQLLPWHVTGRLPAGEETAFQEHLATCESCRQEKGLLDRVSSVLRSSDEEFFAEHPPVELLISTLLGHLTGETAARIHRHIELCDRCENEARCVARAEEVRQREDASRHWRLSLRRWGSVAAAAVIGITAGLYLHSPLPQEGPTGIGVAHFLTPVQRGEDQATLFLPPGASGLTLFLQTDALTEELPINLEIESDIGVVVHRQTTHEPLFRDVYLVVYCARKDFPDGRYRATVTLHNRPNATPQSYNFQIKTTL